VADLECATLPDTARAGLSLGLPVIDRHFPGAGLACGALHEVVAATHGDRPAAFGFVVALMARALAARPGPVILIAPRRCFADFGKPYGHGLRQLGLDVGRLVLIETRGDKDALWAMGEALRSKATAAVAGALERDLDLTMSRRLSLAATASGTPLLLLEPSPAAGASAAATRWRVAAAPAARDRYGAFARCRWSVGLERCRNGRTGQWLFEWDHVAHRFRLAEVLADRAPVEGAGPKGFRLAG
jgi:protein ImuA